MFMITRHTHSVKAAPNAHACLTHTQAPVCSRGAAGCTRTLHVNANSHTAVGTGSRLSLLSGTSLGVGWVRASA